ncbi:DUF445 family protein [Fusobacterium perfoetens]|uniref:DUF445 domain-containing protein n=1 Tax=Fusobacterium perfoetens TaxID=852 RepID=UPI0015A2C55C|nr:DUF445 family protein [Fusobacterium perfoetens]MCF2625742.1 DUF445 family protein [Fusobacterium perfoetens]
MILKCFLLVLIGALIGWITNFIAIKMLFRPYKEVNLIFFKIQGLLPKRRNEIGNSIAEVVNNELVSIKDIISKISSEDIEENIGAVVDRILESRLKEEIIKNFPMAAFFLSESMLDKIRNIIKQSILENKDEMMTVFAEYLESKVDIKSIIVEKVNAFSLEKIEEIIITLAKKELKHIEYIGAVLGGVIGLVQFAVVTFI